MRRGSQRKNWGNRLLDVQPSRLQSAETAAALSIGFLVRAARHNIRVLLGRRCRATGIIINGVLATATIRIPPPPTLCHLLASIFLTFCQALVLAHHVWKCNFPSCVLCRRCSALDPAGGASVPLAIGDVSLSRSLPLVLGEFQNNSCAPAMRALVSFSSPSLLLTDNSLLALLVGAP